MGFYLGGGGGEEGWGVKVQNFVKHPRVGTQSLSFYHERFITREKSVLFRYFSRTAFISFRPSASSK